VTATNVGHAVTVDVSGGGSSLIEDPGNVWEAETPVAEGYRIAVDVYGDAVLYVYEVIVAGTTDDEMDEFDDGDTGLPKWKDFDADVVWALVGKVGDAQSGLIDLGTGVQAEGAVAIKSGDADLASDDDGKNVTLAAGTGDGTGAGGDFSMDAGFSGTGNEGGSFEANGGQETSGGDVELRAGGGNAGQSGGSGELHAGNGDGANDAGAQVNVYGGSGAGVHGRVEIKTNNSQGTAGQLLTADGMATAIWQSLVTFGSADPTGGGYLTPLVFDDTAVTGGLYAWTGADYSKIGLATT
jgi:hypothetical protein